MDIKKRISSLVERILTAKKKVSTLIVCSLFTTLQSQASIAPEKRELYFAIDVPTVVPPGEVLKIYFWKDFIYDCRITEAISPEVVVVQNRYSFILPAIDHLARISVYNSELGEIMSCNLVEPGDSIVATLSAGTSGEFTANFQGRGSEKYNFVRGINLTLAGTMQDINGLAHIREASDPNEIMKRKESLLALYRQKLNFDHSISIFTKNVIEKDIFGVINLKTLSHLTYEYIKSDFDDKKAYGNVLDKLLNFRETTTPNASALSKATIEFYYEQAKIKSIKDRDINFETGDLINTRKITFKNLYDQLKNNFSGVLREQLLAYAITNLWVINMFFGGTDAEEYTDCMKDAMKIVKEPFRKNIIEKQFNTLGKGAPAFDFSLADSTGKVFHLNDFRNKVVFIDMWFNPCGGCKQFRKNFDKIVYPFVKDNPNLAIVSINLDTERTKWMNGLSTYSHPNFINLNIGEQGFNHPMVQHYSIIGAPQLLLIDRKGKIISATVPFSDRYEDLLALIQESLKQ